MKRLLFFIVAILLMSGSSLAQTPRGFNYQAVVRGDNGRLLENQTIGVRITIHQGSIDGDVVYSFVNQLQTNANGLFSLVVGANSEDYDTIRWGNGPYFLVSEIDPSGGINYSLSSSQQILAVPYAEYARVADHVSEAFTYDENDPHFHAWGYSWDSIIGAPTTIAWDSVIGAPTTIAWDSVIGVPTTISQFINDMHLNPILVGNNLIFTSTSDTIDLSSLSSSSVPWSNIVGAPTTIVWDSIVGAPTTIVWDSIVGAPTTVVWDSIVGAPTTIVWDSIVGAPTTIAWDSVIGTPSNLSYFVNDLHINPVLVNDTLFFTTTSDTVNLSSLRTTSLSWDSIIGTPTTIEWDSITGKPTTIDWDSITNAPTNLSYFVNDLHINPVLINDTLFLTTTSDTVNLSSLRTTSLSWDSITGTPTTIKWDSVTGKPTTIVWDSVTGKPTTIAWDSITGKPTTIAWDSVTSKPTTIAWDSVTGKPTTIAWDSITGKPTTITWNNVTGKPTKLSQFNNDLGLTLGAGDTLYIGDSTQKICLRPLHTLTLPWNMISYRPNSLSELHNDLMLVVTNDTLFLIGDTIQNVSLKSLRTTTLPWSQITSRPTNLSDFFNDLHLGANLTNDTLFFPTTKDTVDLHSLRTLTLPWTSIIGRPSKLSQFQNDLRTQKSNDTLFIGDSILYLHRSTLYTHWDSIKARPAWVDTSHYTGTNHTNLHIHNVVSPTMPTDAANKAYVDARLAERDIRIDSLKGVIDSLEGVLNSVQHPVIPGMLPGIFSVSTNKKVVFSQGNLQYHPSMNIFRFAEHQYDFAGLDNNMADLEASGTNWLDLFGYGTSTWSGGRGRFMPWDTRTNNDQYMVDRNAGNGLTGIYSNCDWGCYNTIVNGGNQHSQWRTLTKDEWDYILNIRPNHTSLKTLATVNGFRGLILLPDDWVAPAGINIVPNMTLSGNNTFSSSEWNVMENAGAVFLPVAGYRIMSNTTLDNINGFYWSASHVNNMHSTTLQIRTDTGTSLPATPCSQACSVRLVRDY